MRYDFDPAAAETRSGNWLVSMIPLIAAAIVIIIGMILVSLTSDVDSDVTSGLSRPVEVEQSATAGDL